jgi:hypothetical protein
MTESLIHAKDVFLATTSEVSSMIVGRVQILTQSVQPVPRAQHAQIVQLVTLLLLETV